MSAFPATRRVGVLVFDEFEPLDVWGFIEPFAIARFIGTAYADPPPYPFEVVLVANQDRPDSEADGENGEPALVPSYNGPRVAPDLFRDEALDAELDVLMIPGGMGMRWLLDPEDLDERDRLFHWLHAIDAKLEVMASVCTGSALLAAAGLLDGKPATSNQDSFAWVTGFGPKVLWDNVARWVDAGHYVSSAGVSAGIDMAYHLVARLAGRAVAEQAAKVAEYDWRRDPYAPIEYPAQALVPTRRG